MTRVTDFVAMACMSASVSYRDMLTREELVGALTSGKFPANRFAHFHSLLEEAPEALLRGLVEQISQLTERAKVEESFLKIAVEVQVLDRARRILGG